MPKLVANANWLKLWPDARVIQPEEKPLDVYDAYGIIIGTHKHQVVAFDSDTGTVVFVYKNDKGHYLVDSAGSFLCVIDSFKAPLIWKSRNEAIDRTKKPH